MEFLESLYSIENFGIYLFVIIGILVFLFLLVLFLGKKDQKRRKELEEKLEQTKIESRDSFEEVSAESSLEIPVNTEEVSLKSLEDSVNTEEVKTNDNLVNTNNVLTSNVVLNSDLVNNNVSEEIREEPKKEFDFDALADAISKELAEIDNLENQKNDNQPKVALKNDFNYVESAVKPVGEPIKDENMVNHNLNETEDLKTQEVKPKPVMPSVFSSVYVNREKEEPKVTPAQTSEIELPKMVDLPKKAVQTNEFQNVKKSNDNDIIFP